MRSFNTFLFLFLVSFLSVTAQETAISYEIGERYNDRYKYSVVLNSMQSPEGNTILVRKYFGGIPLKPKGFFIEVYNPNLELIKEYNYKHQSNTMINAFISNNRLVLLELRYNNGKLSYEYVAHKTPLSEFKFRTETLLSFPSKKVENPLRRSRFRGNYKGSFASYVFFDDEKSSFLININFKKGKKEGQHLYWFGTDLKQKLHKDISEMALEKDYVFEYITHKGDELYLMGKAHFKKRRISAKERRFQYELISISDVGIKTQAFNEPGKHPASLKPFFSKDKLLCIGFYADRKDRRFNGLVYFELDPISLSIKNKKYNAFSESFMLDKFGRSDDKEVKNLVFKEIQLDPKGNIFFSAEEFFVTESMKSNSSGGRIKVERFHYNDIICAKFNTIGNMEWVRNINKAEVTQGDASYASYSTFLKDDTLNFFINSGENPQNVTKERILFKQGYSKNPNVFLIQLDNNGKIAHQKLIDDKEARLPLMVSIPCIEKETNKLFFYAKRGSKKQLIKVQL